MCGQKRASKENIKKERNIAITIFKALDNVHLLNQPTFIHAISKSKHMPAQ
jgi:hypothetical protein